MPTRNSSIRLQMLVERVKANEAKVLLKAIKNIEETLRSALGDKELSELSPLQVSRLLALTEGKVRLLGTQLLIDHRHAIEEFVKTQIYIENRLWGKTAQLTEVEAIKAAFDTPLGIDGPDRGSNIESYIENWWRNIRASVFGAVKRGVWEKKTNSQLKKEILGTRPAQYKDGLIDSLKRNAVTTSNTAIQHAFSSVREALMARNGARTMWSALYEKSVCARCRSLDGSIFEPGQGPRSPLHHGCRCIMEPVFDKAVKDENTYYQWLKGQPKEIVAEAIGKTRAELFINGGITVQRFAELQLDRKFEPLTLAELRAVAPSIFANAGV